MSDRPRTLASLILCGLALGWSAAVTAVGQPLSGALSEVPADTVPGLTGLGVNLSESLRETLEDSTQGSMQGGEMDGSVPGRAEYVGGLPGIDGINASNHAVGEALRGLDPALIRHLVGRVEPAILVHLTQSLTQPLPGIHGDRMPGLPGLDGLPVYPRR